MFLKLNQIMRWSGRVLAGLMAAFILVMFLGETLTAGIGSLLTLTLRETLMMGAFLTVFVGLILGWFQERIGGWLIIAGMVAFYLLDFSFSGTFPRGPLFLLIALPGVLYLLAAHLDPDAVKI